MNDLTISGKIMQIKQIETKTGTSMTTAALMSARKNKKTDEWINEFRNVKAFGAVAQSLNDIPDKTKIIVNGRWGQDQYTDKEGRNRTVDYILINSFEVEAKKEEQNFQTKMDIKNDGDIPF